MSQANKSPKKKRGISRVTIPIICVLVAITVALNAAANSTLSGILDAYIGRGEMKIETKAGAENWDTTYYDQDSTNAEDADRVAKDITLRTAEEGITLLKNEGSTLPLNTAAEKNVTLLGRRSVQTVFGGTGSGAGDTNQCVGIADALTAAGFQVNPTVLAMYQSSLDKVPVADPASAMDKAEKQTYYIGEFPRVTLLTRLSVLIPTTGMQPSWFSDGKAAKAWTSLPICWRMSTTLIRPCPPLLPRRPTIGKDSINWS